MAERTQGPQLHTQRHPDSLGASQSHRLRMHANMFNREVEINLM